MAIIRLNSDNQVLGAVGFPLPNKIWSFNFGEVPPETTVYTDVVDLGENYPYTLLVARKSGSSSPYESLGIDSSVDGVKWGSALGVYKSVLVASFRPYNNREIYNVWGRPVGRYVRVYHYSGSSGQSELIIDLVALSGI